MGRGRSALQRGFRKRQTLYSRPPPAGGCCEVEGFQVSSRALSHATPKTAGGGLARGAGPQRPRGEVWRGARRRRGAGSMRHACRARARYDDAAQQRKAAGASRTRGPMRSAPWAASAPAHMGPACARRHRRPCCCSTVHTRPPQRETRAQRPANRHCLGLGCRSAVCPRAGRKTASACYPWACPRLHLPADMPATMEPGAGPAQRRAAAGPCTPSPPAPTRRGGLPSRASARPPRRGGAPQGPRARTTAALRAPLRRSTCTGCLTRRRR